MIDYTVRRPKLPYGYVTYTGVEPSNYQIDRYNSIQDDINRWIDDGREVPEWLLNWSHEYYKLIAREWMWIPRKD